MEALQKKKDGGATSDWLLGWKIEKEISENTGATARLLCNPGVFKEKNPCFGVLLNTNNASLDRA
jgi:5'(3')-deoxyribonucleotidase